MAYQQLHKKKHSNSDSALDLDYPKLIFLQINRINVSQLQNMNMWRFAIDSLKDMLEPYAIDNEKYKEESIKIIKEYDKAMQEARRDERKQKDALNEKYRKMFRLCMVLMRENDLMPEQNDTYSDLESD